MPWDAVMPKYARGELRSSSGQKVTDRKQALAIMFSEKRAARHKPEYRHRRMLDEALKRK